MAIQFEDILSALCSEVTLSHATEAQKIYLLRDTKEAQLARDVLTAYGFDVKVYDEDGAAKFYITLPALEAALVEQKLSAALTYAVSLKQIKESLDTLCDDPAAQAPDYTIMLANIPSTGKQIVVHFASPPPDTGASPAVTKQASDARGKAMKAKHRPAAAAGQSIFSGPAVGKASYRAAARHAPDGMGKVMYNYIGGYIVTSIYAMLAVIVFLLVLYTLFTFAKSFLCPDFATENAKQNHAWYCNK